MLCPICLKQKNYFEGHHVIWRMDGGSNHPINILQICKTCHAILTFGGEEAYFRDKACVAHQLFCYGLEFVLHSHLKKSKNSLLLTLLDIKKSNRNAGFSKFTACEADKIARQIGQSSYHLMMGVIHGIVTMEEFEKARDDDSLAYKLSKRFWCYLPNNTQPNKAIKPTAKSNGR